MKARVYVKEPCIEHTLGVGVPRHFHARLPKVAPSLTVLVAQMFELKSRAPVREPNGFQRRLWMVQIRNHRCNRLEAFWPTALRSYDIGPCDARLGLDRI